jgi:hypothetical protein
LPEHGRLFEMADTAIDWLHRAFGPRFRPHGVLALDDQWFSSSTDCNQTWLLEDEIPEVQRGELDGGNCVQSIGLAVGRPPTKAHRFDGQLSDCHLLSRTRLPAAKKVTHAHRATTCRTARQTPHYSELTGQSVDSQLQFTPGTS